MCVGVPAWGFVRDVLIIILTTIFRQFLHNNLCKQVVIVHVIISTEDDHIHRGWPLFTTVFVRVGITFSDEFVNISWIMYVLLA